MPFEPAPKITTNPWTERRPKEARALADLAKHLRTLSPRVWNFNEIWCGTAGCALGHTPEVPSCVELGFTWNAVRGSGRGGEVVDMFNVWRLPPRSGLFDGSIAMWFFSTSSYRGSASDVTADMVADRIEHWLATDEIR